MIKLYNQDAVQICKKDLCLNAYGENATRITKGIIIIALIMTVAYVVRNASN